MLQLFRSNQFLSNILYIPYLIAFALISYYQGMFPQEINPIFSGFFGDKMSSLLGSLSPLQLIIAGNTLVFLQAVALNILCSLHNLCKENNLLPGLFYCLLISFTSQNIYLTDVLIANIFLLFSINEVLSGYKSLDGFKRIFNSGLWISVASLFHFSIIGLAIWAFISILQLRSFRAKERIALLLSLIIPYYLVGVYFYTTNQWDLFLNKLPWKDLFPLSFGSIGLAELPILSLFALFVVLILINSRLLIQKRQMQTQRKVRVVVNFLLVSLLLFLFDMDDIPSFLQLICLPLAILFGGYFSVISKKWGEVYHFILLLLCLGLKGNFLLDFFLN